jgi:hypothetical protein
LVIVVTNWYTFSLFDMPRQEKSGNPAICMGYVDDALFFAARHAPRNFAYNR